MDDQLIKPVIANQNVIALTSAKDLKEKKKRQDFSEQRENDNEDENLQDEFIEPNAGKANADSPDVTGKSNSIDFCA